MTEFDYERAHAEVAAPLYRSLPKRIHRLVARVDLECRELRQNQNLDMPWATLLREAFERLDTHELAHAAQVVYEYGHWGSRSCLQANGTYWKFSNYCDQVLRDRLGLSRDPAGGLSFGVQQGQLHVYWASRQEWLNREIGAASKGLLKEAQSPKFFGDYPDANWGRILAAGPGYVVGGAIDWFEQRMEKFVQSHPVGDLSEYEA